MGLAAVVAWIPDSFQLRNFLVLESDAELLALVEVAPDLLVASFLFRGRRAARILVESSWNPLVHPENALARRLPHERIFIRPN